MAGTTEVNLWTAAQIVRMSPREIPVFLHSDSGIGKTQVLGQIAEADGLRFKSMIAQILAPTDVQGLPTIHRDDGLPAYVEYVKPALLPSEEWDGPDGIWFVDEFPNAPRAVQAALQTIFTQGMLNDYQFPSGWKQVAAGNRLEDRANTFELPRPVANRFMHIYVKADHSVFLEWGSQSSAGSRFDAAMFGGDAIKPFPKVADITRGKPRIHPSVRAFLGMRPTMIFNYVEGSEAFATPRTWQMASWVLWTEPSEEFRIPMLFGLLGQAAGSEFESYLQDISILPDMRGLLEGDYKLEIEEGETLTCYIEGNGYARRKLNAARQYAIAIGLPAVVDTKSEKDVDRFFDVIENLAGADQQIVAVTEIALKDPQVNATKRSATWWKGKAQRMPKLLSV